MITIIIIKRLLYSAYFLDNLIAEARRTISFGAVMSRDRLEPSLEHGTADSTGLGFSFSK